ncbi:hypothetical protein INT47_007762, partial [Mucor saturninus]
MDEHISKEEKKKKAHRRRDKFWKFIFPHSKSTEFIQPTEKKRTADQLEKITSLSKYGNHNFSVTLDPELYESILEHNDWDFKKAMIDLIDYEEASHGILKEPPTSSNIKLLGAENDGGTSCYIDALLFAMYISNTTFDPLLTYDIPVDNDSKIKLQTLMRLFVNKLRKGHFINADFVHWFRKVLQEADWVCEDTAGHWTQGDSSELFMFITETFELPYLPFQVRLFHGANKDTSDDRVTTERTLSLSIPKAADNDEMNENIQLQDILVDCFYNSIITDVQRQVSYEHSILENVASSPSIGTVLQDTMKLEKDSKSIVSELQPQGEQEIAVTAWQVLELLPFYSGISESGNTIDTQFNSSFPDTHMILPIVLKRYEYDACGGTTKLKRRVEIPITIDFNKFINQNADDPMCPTCGHLVDWTLHFKSAVCHKGNSLNSGHYISYARMEDVEGETYWLKFDDMNRDSRVSVLGQTTGMFEDLSQNAYIIFYELDKTCHHGSLTSDDSDDEVSRKDDDFKSTHSTSTAPVQEDDPFQ